MSQQLLEQLGLSTEELQDRLIDRIMDDLSDGEGLVLEKGLWKRISELVKQRIDERVDALATEHVLPNVSKYIEDLTLQETTRWGEKKGEPQSFVEYLISRANDYLSEPVDWSGKDKAQGGYAWSKNQTRIAHMIHAHLHHSIENAMKAAVQHANNAISVGIQETVKIKLEEIVKGLRTTVEVKR